MKWVIEFRNGSFFQGLDAEVSGPKETAVQFDSETDVDTYLDEHEWVLLNGGMAVPLEGS